MIGIYKIVNPKGKIYIGQSIDIDRRWKDYMNIRHKAMGIKIYNSLKKYGPENHIFEVIEECKLEQLNEKELYWTMFYDAIHPFGLVLQAGGTYGYMSDGSKIKMSLAKKGKPNLKLRGFKYSKNSKIKMSLAKNKSILQYDKNGEFIQEWSSLTKAAISLKGCTPFISKVCRGEKELAYGFKWRFKI